MVKGELDGAYSNFRGTERAPLDFDGPGVTERVIERWRNEANPDKRRTAVKGELNKAFGVDQRSPNVYRDVREDSAAENPAGWLVYSVLSVFLNKSEGITPAGRLRVLELFELYPAQELAE